MAAGLLIAASAAKGLTTCHPLLRRHKSDSHSLRSIHADNGGKVCMAAGLLIAASAAKVLTAIIRRSFTNFCCGSISPLKEARQSAAGLP
jgi:hypothetical protein